MKEEDQTYQIFPRYSSLVSNLVEAANPLLILQRKRRFSVFLPCDSPHLF